MLASSCALFCSPRFLLIRVTVTQTTQPVLRFPDPIVFHKTECYHCGLNLLHQSQLNLIPLLFAISALTMTIHVPSSSCKGLQSPFGLILSNHPLARDGMSFQVPALQVRADIPPAASRFTHFAGHCAPPLPSLHRRHICGISQAIWVGACAWTRRCGSVSFPQLPRYLPCRAHSRNAPTSWVSDFLVLVMLIGWPNCPANTKQNNGLARMNMCRRNGIGAPTAVSSFATSSGCGAT